MCWCVVEDDVDGSGEGEGDEVDLWVEDEWYVYCLC